MLDKVLIILKKKNQTCILVTHTHTHRHSYPQLAAYWFCGHNLAMFCFVVKNSKATVHAPAAATVAATALLQQQSQRQHLSFALESHKCLRSFQRTLLTHTHTQAPSCHAPYGTRQGTTGMQHTKITRTIH